MRSKILLFLSFFVTATMFAGPVSKDEAAQKAQAFINGKSKQPTSGPRRVKLAHRQMTAAQTPQEDALYYVFNIGEKDGFVIVSGDDRTPDVLGYADNGSFDAADMPDNMRAWLQGYADQLSWLQQHPEVQNTIQKAPTKNVVLPLLASQWNQNNPYNQQCPTYSGELCVTGCVATAMAQVMYYYRWPNATAAQISGYTTSTKRLSVGAVPAGTTFDWDNMLPVYGNGATTAQQTAVATLMKACGASVGMDYDLSRNGGSGAYLDPEALITYFNYSETTHEILRENYSFADWNSVIYAELAENRPVLYSGQSSGGGHQFVVDGYDGDELFHVNWGWGGSSDGYFLLSILNPYNTTGIGASSSNDGYSFGQRAVIGVKPYDGETLQTGVKMTSSINSVSGYQIDSSYRNNAGGTYSFDFGIGFLNEDGSITAISSSSVNNLGQGWGYGSWPFTIPSGTITSLSDGIYKIVPISKEKGTETWYVNVDAKKEYVEVVVENGNATLSLHKAVMALQATTFNYPGNKKAGSSQSVDVTIQNNGDEFYGVLYLFASTTDTKGSYQSRSGVTILENKSIGTQFTFTPTAAGTYNIWICTDASGNNVIGQSSVVIEAASTETYSLSAQGLTIENGNPSSTYGGNIYGTRIKGTFSLKNTGTTTFENDVTIKLYIYNGSNYSYLREQSIATSIGAGETKDIEFDFSSLDKTKYVVLCSYGNSKTQYPQYNSYTLADGVEIFMADGTSSATGAQSSVTVSENVAAVNLTGVSGVMNVTGGNENTLFIFGADDNVPASLNGRNVVKGSNAENITLQDGCDFYSPVTFTAEKISYTRTFAEGLSRDYKGWTTLVLPFEVKDVKVNLSGTEYPIDWFHSADETKKNFWVMDFGSEENGVVYYAHAEKILAARPYIIAVPDVSWGSKNDLTNLPITFYGENATVSGDFRASTSGENYKMKGVVAKSNLSNVYVLNDDGTAFERQSAATVDAFRAYFEPTSTAANANMLMMVFGNGEVTALQDFSVDEKVSENSGVYDLQGRKVNLSTLPKGIYVVNGKKVVVK